MNKERRAALSEITAKLMSVSIDLELLRQQLEELKDEEQDYFDNMPESLQGSERGQRTEDVVSQLEDAASELDAIDLDAVVSQIEAAAA